VSCSGFVAIHVGPYVCGGRCWFVLLSSEVLLGGQVCSGFVGFDFFHEGLKRVVRLFTVLFTA